MISNRSGEIWRRSSATSLNPDDKYLPSYLVFAAQAVGGFHVLFGVDVASDHVRVVTAYRPHLNDWEPDLKTRRIQT